MPNPPVAAATSEPENPHLGYSSRMRQRDRLWRTSHLGRNAVCALALLALVVNVLWMIGLQHVMLVTPTHDRSSDAIQVSVIEPVDAVPLPEEPQPAVFQRRPSRIAIAPPQTKLTPPPPRSAVPSATSARIGTATEAAVRLFNADGSLRMPEARTRIGPEKIGNPQEAAKARWAEIEKRGDNPLDCKRTRFAQNFRRDESIGDEVSRKYLSWIGLADGAVIAERAAEKDKRAADGCDPAG